ncbi:MAG TPA: hypothetical protein VEB21_16365 [Terriglobales bacterium]|nr:hypothetical protein [Terriglobales bacterium]
MGRDLTLYPRKASKGDLKSYLEALGFEKCGHFWDWPRGTLNYSWFDERDFRSVDGVSADIFPLDDAKAKLAGNRWALHVRNLYSASWYDVKMLNDVLRGARKRFGGTIKGDYGTNKYAPLWHDTSTPLSRGLSAVYERVSQDLNALKSALPDSAMIRPAATPMDAKMYAFEEWTQSFDPVRILYNGLVPFAVSMFEYFFSRVFEVLVAYDSVALEKRSSYTQRVDFSTLFEVSQGKKKIEEVIAESYSFQNLSQINKGYKEWLSIDVRKVLFRKKRIGGKILFLETRVADIIQQRHGVVHRLDLDRSLTKEGYIAILDAIDASITEFRTFLERKYGIKIGRI